MHNSLPIIDNITPEKIKQLINVGFAYVQLPRKIENSLSELHSAGLTFFRRNREYKKQWLVNENFEGYVDRQEGKDPQSIQQMFFRPKQPIGDFIKHSKTIEHIYEIFHDHIALPLLEKIFFQSNLGQYYKEACEKTFPTLSFAYYPEKTSCLNALKSHKDFDMITVLSINKPGLEVFYKGSWYPIDPLPDYVVVNLGNALEIMLDKKCTSALHRVKLIQAERLSIGLFVGPGGLIKNFVNNRIIHNTYTTYLRSQFNQQYEKELTSLYSGTAQFVEKSLIPR